MTLTIDVTESTFMAAILAKPREDAPRLVYADWLEEHGDTARAEFIRIGCKMASCRMCHRKDGTKRKDGYSANCGRCKPLRRREQALLEQHGAEWAKPVCDILDCGFDLANQHIRFERGFIGAVELRMEEFVGGRCERCDGDGQAHGSDRPSQWSSDPNYMKCPVCHGTGRVPGIAKELFRAAPITSVKLTGKRPTDAVHSLRYGWPWIESNSNFCIPFDPLGMMMSKDLSDGFYRTEADVYAALSRACVRYGREQAGLGKLK